MSPAISIADLSVHYDDRLALDNVAIDIERGTTLAVIGPNGSGKSTLLRAIAGLAKPTHGSVSTTSDPALVLQATDVDQSVPITVHDTVAIARYASTGLLRRFRDEDHRAIEHAMGRLDIADLAARQLHELSGGQRQRVFVAQGLAQTAALLLLDEPVNGLDVVSREIILSVIAEERAEGRTVIVTTHNLEDARRCDQVLLLATHAVASGTPSQVLTEEHLHSAFGGRVLRVGSDFVLDDPHHVH